MKSFLLGVAVLLTINVFAQQPVKFKATAHSFGKIKQHKPVTTAFEFTNVSAKPIIIETATASCGCTSPEYPKGAIPAGKTGTIKVTFNAEATGPINKTVTVKLAGVNEPIVLAITGEVLAAPAPSAAKKGK
jgi:hypothetical protein